MTQPKIDTTQLSDAVLSTDSLGDGTVGQILTAQGAGNAPIWADLDASVLSTAALGDGTSGQVITSQGAGNAPIWDDLPAPTGLHTKVAVPANSAAAGSDGEYAISGTSLYVYNGTQWIHFTGATF